ncbi:MAG: hypothetical protein FJ386_14190 [Verrucomicrobia bacterium]|nr:hypothetical protein [Verrucomicrobiota bacterium]
MINPRHKPLVIGGVVLAVVWAVAMAVYLYAKAQKVTAEKVAAQVAKTELAKLSAEERRKALRKLAAMLNSLQVDERRVARAEADWDRLVREMTEEERLEFLESTLPSGVKQMLTNFEQLPPDRRKRILGDSLKRLQEARDNPEVRERMQSEGRQPGPPLSEEAQKRLTQVGLNTFYTQSSAQSKAELAPLIEELQRAMQQGRFMPR